MNKLGMVIFIAASACSCVHAQQIDPRDGFGYSTKGTTSYKQSLPDARDASKQTSTQNNNDVKDWTARPAQPDADQIKKNPLKVEIRVPPPPQQTTSFYDPTTPYTDPWAVDPLNGYSRCEWFLRFAPYDPTIQVPDVCNKRAQQVRQMQGVAQQIQQLTDRNVPYGYNTSVTQATYKQVPDQSAIQDAAAAQGLQSNIGATANGAQQGNR